MIQLVIIKNPFEPYNGRETRFVEAGLTAKEIAEKHQVVGTEMTVVVNSEQVPDDYVVKDNDFVVVCPVVGKSGKQIFGLILGIALSIGAGLLISQGLSVAGNVLIKAGSLGAYLAATAVMFMGNILVGRMNAQGVDMGDYGETNPTYSWGEIQTMQGQNNAVALTYGTVVSGGQSIGKYVNTLDNEEYLNWLVAAGEGPLEITDIKLNDNAISYYEGVEVETREGTNTQTVISNFNDTYNTKSLGYELTDTVRTDTVPGDGTEGIIVRIEFPGGLYYANDDGGLDGAWVQILGEYRLGENGEWIPFVYAKHTPNQYITSTSNDAPTGTYHLYVWTTTIWDGYGDDEHIVDQYTSARITYPDTTIVEKQRIIFNQEFTLGYFKVKIPAPPNDDEYNYQTTETLVNEDFTVSEIGQTFSGSQSSAIRREVRVDNLTPGQYYVRLQVTARSHALTNSRASVRCSWVSVTQIIYDDFCYPNIALIGIRALATSQLNGSPTLKFTKTNPYIYAWNPHTEQYEQKPSNNPAWASYDALHLCRYLEDPNNLGTYVYDVSGVSADRMLYDQFEEWAEFCDDKEYYVNIEINQIGEMLDVINQKIAPIGHGKVLRFGTRYGCTWDCAKLPVQMFGMGNIKAGTFQEQFMATNDRANAVELTYMDADAGFNRETVTILADDYDTAVETKTAQATFDGITSYEQAYREGKYQLYCNKYRLRTISFEADIDAISCTIGDVVLVAHDVPKWAKSGRIYEVNGDELLLPCELEDSTLNYRLLYRTVNDNMYTTNCEILDNHDGWCKVRMDTFNADDPPQPQDIFDLAIRSVGSKPFIIQNISRSKQFSRKIECVEYDERIYNEDYDIPPIEYTEEDTRPKNVTFLSARAYHYLTADGITMEHIDISWQQASSGTFTVFVNDGTTWNMVANGLKTNQYSADLNYDATEARVVTVLGVISTSGTSVEVENIDTILSQLDITGLTVDVVMSGDVGTVTATWDEITASNFKNYVVGFRGSEYNTLNATAEYGGVPLGTYTLTVKAKALDGTYGTPASETVVVEVPED